VAVCVSRRLHAVASWMVKKDFKQSCAMGTVALDISAEEEQPLRALCQQALTRWAQTAARCMPEILDPVPAHTLRPELVTGLVTPWADAPQALLEPSTKVIISLQ
jgi:hypothetical protein